MAKKRRFKIVPGPFGGKDEQATQDAFVDFVGGTRRADRLSYVSQNSYPSGMLGSPYYKTREEMFRINAKREGFTDEEIDAFLML